MPLLAEQRVKVIEGQYRGRHGEIVDTFCFSRRDSAEQVLIEVRLDGFQNTTLHRDCTLKPE